MTLTRTLTRPLSTPTFSTPLTHPHALLDIAEQSLTRTLTDPHTNPHAKPLTFSPLSISRGKREADQNDHYSRSSQGVPVPIATNELMARPTAVREIAGRIADRTHYVMISPTDRLPGLAHGLAERTNEWCAYLDSRSGMVLRTPHVGTLSAIELFIETAGVLTVPKTVPSSALAAVVDQAVPEDGSQDLIVLFEPGKPMFWPTLFVDAIDLVDPKVAATIRANQIQNLN